MEVPLWMVVPLWVKVWSGAPGLVVGTLGGLVGDKVVQDPEGVEEEEGG